MAYGLRFRPDIPFSKDDSNRFLPWIIAFIVFIAAMMVASGVGLYEVVHGSRQERADSFSVHIPAGTNSEQNTNALVSALKTMPGVAKATPVGDAEMRELVKPWLGSNLSPELIPLPRIVEVMLAHDRPDMDALKRKILSIVPNAEIDDHAAWLLQYTSLLLGLQWSLWAAAALFVFTTLAIVILTTRASIKIHQRVIQILHTIGALDSYIARQFQYNAFLIAGKGAMIGSMVALLLYLSLCLVTADVSVPLLPSFRLTGLHVVLFLLLPLLVGLGAMISSRLTVLAELRRMP